MKNNLLTWVVLVLVIANLVILTIFLSGRGNGHPGPPEQASDFIVRELKFTEDQQKSYMELVSEHRTMAAGARENIRKAKNNFFELLQSAEVNDSLKQAALKTIGKQTEDLDLITFDHFKKVRDLCTPDQQKKFDSIINQVLRMMSGPRPREGIHPRSQSPPPN
jgi:hypothetical protein